MAEYIMTEMKKSSDSISQLRGDRPASEVVVLVRSEDELYYTKIIIIIISDETE